MRKSVLALAAGALGAFAAMGPASASGQDLDTSLRTLTEANGALYAGPVASGVGAALSSAWYRTPEVRELGEFYVGVEAMGAWVPESDKSFRPVLPASVTVEELNGQTYTDPYGSAAGVSTPSAAGEGAGAVIEPQGQLRQDLLAAGLNPADYALRFPSGLGIFAVPSVMGRLTVGMPHGTEVTLRYLPSLDVMDEVGSVDAFGFGLRHQIDRWLPAAFPLQLSLAAGIQSMDLGDILSSESRTVQLVAGKDLGLAGFYGSLRWEDSEASVQYDLQAPQLTAEQRRVEFTRDGANSFGLTVGATLDVILKLNVSYTLSEYDVLSAGAGFGI